MCFGFYEWITEHNVPECKNWGCNDVIPNPEDSCGMLRSATHFVGNMSCKTGYSATHFIGDTTHPQIANHTKSPQLLYKSKNTSYIPQIIFKCVAIEG